MPRFVYTLACAPILFCVAVTGCGPNPNIIPKGSVSGTVTVDGKPLTYGTIAFYIENKPYSGQVFEGKYTVARMPPGNAKVTVNHLPIPEEELPTGKEQVKTPIPQGGPVTVPQQFRDPEKTPLAFTVTEAAQEKSFDLK